MTSDGVKSRVSRGRPRDEEKNTAIISAATHLFLEQGFTGTSMDEVARRAGVSKQTVYSHFSSKEQLFGSAIRAAVENHFPDTVLGKLESHSLEGDLKAVCSAYARLLLSTEAIALHRILVAEAHKGAKLGKLFWESGPAEMEEKFQAVLQAWVNSGDLKIPDIKKAAELMLVILKGRPHFLTTIGVIEELTDDIIQTNVETAVEVFLKLYRA